VSEDRPVSVDHKADYSTLDDSTLIAMRTRVRDQLALEPANMADLIRTHHLLSREVVRRTIALHRQVRHSTAR
jgi:hypothetical protein